MGSFRAGADRFVAIERLFFAVGMAITHASVSDDALYPFSEAMKFSGRGEDETPVREGERKHRAAAHRWR